MSPERAFKIVAAALFLGSVAVARENYALGVALFVSSGAFAIIDWRTPRE